MIFYNIVVSCKNFEIERYTTNRSESVKIYKHEINHNKDNPYKPVIISLQYLSDRTQKTVCETEV